MSEHKRNEKPRHLSLTAAQIVAATASILLGVLLTFVPGADNNALCTFICVLLVAGGVASIIYFFASGAYRRLDDYSFALGVLLLILGCVGFVRIEDMAASLTAYMGFLVLLLGVLALQNTVQLLVLKSQLWGVTLVFTLLIIFGGVTVLLPIEMIWNALQYWVLIVAGILALASLLMTAIVLRKTAKAEEKPDTPPPSPPEDGRPRGDADFAGLWHDGPATDQLPPPPPPSENENP